MKLPMIRFHLRIPHLFTSTIEAGQERSRAVLDGSDVVVPNYWKLLPHTVALIGRPAVWIAFEARTPRIPLGFTAIASRTLRWEQDFGGHLFVAITDADAANATIIESGPMHANGTGALVPYAYPEDDFAKRGVMDFEPIVIAPPNGMTEDFFAQLVRTTQRNYDGDQRYVAIEIPFLRVGRDSNSYAVGVLLCCGVDPRAVTMPKRSLRFEWTGYPGAEDPVHRANFGTYAGAPARLGEHVVEIAHHNPDGTVRLVVIGGEPQGRARLPNGSAVELDALGRIALSPEDAERYGLPTKRTEPPAHIVARRHFPEDPSPAGAMIALIVDERCVPLAPGTRYRGTIVERHEALGIATLRTQTSDVVLSLAELGVELRDPKRVSALFREGVEITVGLHRDRHPKLVAHRASWVKDRLKWRRLHTPRPINLMGTAAAATVLLAAGLLLWRRRAP